MKTNVVARLKGDYGKREWECTCGNCGHILKVITSKCPKCGAELKKKGCKNVD